MRRDVFSGITLLSKDVIEAEQSKFKPTILHKAKT